MLPEEMRPAEVLAEGGTATEQAAEAMQKTVRTPRPRKGGGKGGAIVVDGADDLLVKVSRCCMPVPGDQIVGFITSGRGISVHKSDCQNFLATDPARHIEVKWAEQTATGHQVQVQVVAMDHKGLIAELGSRISGADADIVSMEARTSSENLAIVNLVLGVQSLGHLEKLLTQLRQISGVLEARRK